MSSSSRPAAQWKKSNGAFLACSRYAISLSTSWRSAVEKRSTYCAMEPPLVDGELDMLSELAAGAVYCDDEDEPGGGAARCAALASAVSFSLKRLYFSRVGASAAVRKASQPSRCVRSREGTSTYVSLQYLHFERFPLRCASMYGVKCSRTPVSAGRPPSSSCGWPLTLVLPSAHFCFV